MLRSTAENEYNKLDINMALCEGRSQSLFGHFLGTCLFALFLKKSIYDV